MKECNHSKAHTRNDIEKNIYIKQNSQVYHLLQYIRCTLKISFDCSLKIFNENYVRPRRLSSKLLELPGWLKDRLQTGKEFCQTTTFHGFNIITDDSNPKWIQIGSAIIVLSLLATFISAAINTSNFELDAMTTEIGKVTVDSQSFPIIHICDNTFFSKRRLQGNFLK